MGQFAHHSAIQWLEDEEDITANVVAAMELESERKQQLIEKHLPRWLSGTFQQFAGVEDSKIIRQFKDRHMIYKRWHLKKQIPANN